MLKHVFPVILATLFVLGCTIDDEDRCPGGLEWDPDILACREIADASAGDAGDDGYLTPCDGPGECDAYEADFCLYDPAGTVAGICVLQGCGEGTCPTDSLCCDCSGIGYPVICIPEAAVTGSLLETSCTCTP
jgi:hypothetical protein